MDKKIELFFEEIENDYQEAVIRKQISPEARSEVDKSREGHKKLSNEILSQRDLSKDFHALSPLEKNRVAKEAGYGGTKKERGKILDGSPIHPDVLFTLVKSFHARGADGQTFIYDIKDDSIASLGPDKIHYDVELGDKKFESERDDDDFVHGRWVDLEKDIDMTCKDDQEDFFLVEPYKFKSGKHLSFWGRLDDDDVIKKILVKLSTNDIDYIHMPSKKALNWMNS